jgi:esterase/lipase superfamily enzyme
MRFGRVGRLFAPVALVVLVSCAKVPELVGIDNPQEPVATKTETTKRKVFIATTRAASEVVGVFYSGQRAPDLGFASVVVSIPPNHVAGEIERPKRLPPDPDTEFAVIEPTVYGTDDLFVRQLNRELAKLPPNERNVLFFVHGYNNTITDSILRLAQFVEDTNFSGIPVLFSWASGAQATRYVYDLNSALIARPKLIEASRVVQRTNATGFSYLAHSMGAFLTVEAIVQAQIAGRYGQDSRLKNLMLASPDIDLDLFRSQMSYLPKDKRGFFILVSKDDAALRFSRRLSGGVDRVGAADAQELADLGVSVIDLSEIDDSASGSHSKFAGSPEIVQLIGSNLQKSSFGKPARSPTLVEVLQGVPVLNVIGD